MMDDLLLVARVLLAIVFLASGITKLFDLPGSAQSLGTFGVPPPWRRPSAFLLVAFELALAIGLLIDGIARAAGLAAFLLPALFTTAVVRVLRQGERPTSHCFGTLASHRVSPWTIARNGVFMVLAGVAALFGAGASLPAIFALPAWNAASLALVIALAKGGDAASASGAHPAMHEGAAPSSDLITSRETSVEKEGSQSSLALIFIDPDCPSCVRLLPDISRWQRRQQGVAIVIITVGSPIGPSALAERLAIPRPVSDPDLQLFRAFALDLTPSAVLMQRDGRLSRHVGYGEVAALESIIILPAALPKG